MGKIDYSMAASGNKSHHVICHIDRSNFSCFNKDLGQQKLLSLVSSYSDKHSRDHNCNRTKIPNVEIKRGTLTELIVHSTIFFLVSLPFRHTRVKYNIG